MIIIEKKINVLYQTDVEQFKKTITFDNVQVFYQPFVRTARLTVTGV